MTCGFEGFERFARLKADWLGKHLKLPNGTPSNDTFRRIFTRLKPREFCDCFTSYLTSLPPDAEELLKFVRQHWSIENQCHWVLDMTFGEDCCRVRKGNAPENLALLRIMALSLLKHDTSVKDSVRGKRLQAILDEKILETFLCLPSPR